MSNTPEFDKYMPHPDRDKKARRVDKAGDASHEGVDSTLDAFRRLAQTAADTGRDWKLVDALLQTTIELVLETEGDLFITNDPQVSEMAISGDAEPSHAEAGAEPRLRLRPEYRLRLEAVIDSWSDDETAGFLMISPRQVQRRAKQGTLYYFLVNRKRRYPLWQFDRFCGVLEGISQLGQAFPDSWPAERVYAFMTTQSPALKSVTPAQWLLMKRDPGQITSAIASKGAQGI